jgi:post-segregation antitoxin (ccd killing protein)
MNALVRVVHYVRGSARRGAVGYTMSPVESCRGRLGATSRQAYSMRMPRMQVYLPEDLYRVVKDRGLPASELLQRAVQAELRRQGLLEETDRYLQDLVAEVGAPNADAMAKADALSRRVRRARTDRRAS